MKKTENTRNLYILSIFLAISCAICIANIVKLNIFALILDMIMIVAICFVLGYNYCKYDIEKSSKNYELEEKFENTTNLPIIKHDNNGDVNI
jgi:uncharacterized membrane protein YphA (DoxX/SURF4 family)